MEVNIRIMEKDDIDFCSKIVTELLNEPEDVTSETLKAYHEDQQKNSLILLVEVDGKRVGFAGILIEGCNSIGNIEWIGIIEQYHHKRIGSKLLSKLVDFAKKKRVRKIYVDAAVDNLNAIAFYIKNKFYPEAVLREYYLNGKDALKMAYKF